MTKETLISDGFTAEQADRIIKLHMEALATATENLIPKTKFDEVAAEVKALKLSVNERDKQLTDLKSSTGDTEALKKQLTEAIAKNEADSKTAKAELESYKLNNALDLALIKAGSKNPTAVKGLLKLDKIVLDGDNIIGLTDQLEAIKASDGYLFSNLQNLTGREPNTGSTSATTTFSETNNPFKKETFNLTKQGELLNQDPTLYNKLKSQAQ